jgi:hypothetical protein
VTVALVVPEGTELAKAFTVLGAQRSAFGDHAVVGGIAIMVRMAQVHRATNDIDSLRWLRRTSRVDHAAFTRRRVAAAGDIVDLLRRP